MALLKSTNVIGNLSATGNIIASKFILSGGNNNSLLLAGGNTKLISDFATSDQITAVNTSINNLSSGKVSKAGDTMSGALTFTLSDAIKYQNGTTRTGVPIRFYGGDANGSAVVIGDGGLTLIGGGESASNLRTALVDTNKTKTNATEELYLTSDSDIYLYTNYQTAASTKITKYDGSGNWTMPGTITATTFTGNLSGNATSANATFTNSVSGDTHAVALKSYFDNNKATTPRNKLLSFYSSAYGNGSQCMGYFLNGYDSTPYGGFFVAHYNSPKYVGIQGGEYTEWELSKVGHNHNDLYLQLSGGTLTGTLTLEPASDEGGQILLNAATNDQTSNGIAIDTAWGDFRLFGLASRDGTTKTGIGSIFSFDPYEQKISIITETQGSSHFKYNTSDKCIDVIFN